MIRVATIPWPTLLLFGLCRCLPRTTTAQELLWSDEFDSDGAPDPNVWGYDVGNWGWGNNEYQDYTSNMENAYVQDGSLHIQAIRRENDNSATPFSSARVKTDGKVLVKYGTIEARIQIPDVANGLWPAFWTMGANFQSVGWPAAGEMDILEMGDGHAIDQGVPNRRVVAAVHLQRDNGEYFYDFYWKDPPYDLHLDYHTFKLEWTPDFVRMSVDDYQTHYFRLDNCNDCQELHEPHYLLMNLAVGGDFTYRPNSGEPWGPDRITATLPATMKVDWVRVYDNGFTELSGPGADGGNVAPTAIQPAEPITLAPLLQPTLVPVVSPTENPVASPTESPVASPTEAPSTLVPTDAPVTLASVVQPTSDSPTEVPVDSSTEMPVVFPTEVPSTVAPTDTTATLAPVVQPISEAPTEVPSASPTASPTEVPSTIAPTDGPVQEITRVPTPISTEVTPDSVSPSTPTPTTQAPSVQSLTETTAPSIASDTDSVAVSSSASPADSSSAVATTTPAPTTVSPALMTTTLNGTVMVTVSTPDDTSPNDDGGAATTASDTPTVAPTTQSSREQTSSSTASFCAFRSSTAVVVAFAIVLLGWNE